MSAVLSITLWKSPIFWQFGYFTASQCSQKSELSLVSAAYKSKTFKCSLTEVAECLLHFADIDVCLHLNEVLHKGIAEGILTMGRESKGDSEQHQYSTAETSWRPL